MTTIQQVVDIPEDHKLHLDLPQDVPTGRAEIRVTIIPRPEQPENDPKRKPFEGLAGSLKDSPAFKRDAVELQREMRGHKRPVVNNKGAIIRSLCGILPPDVTLEEAHEARIAKHENSI